MLKMRNGDTVFLFKEFPRLFVLTLTRGKALDSNLRRGVVMLTKIGEAALINGLTQRTLRYWENSGLIVSTRGSNGYRYYDQENLAKVKDIQVMRHLGLSLDQICQILTAQDEVLLASSLRQLAKSHKAKSKNLEKLSEQLMAFCEKIEALTIEAEKSNGQLLVFESALCAIKNSIYNTSFEKYASESLNTKEMILPMVEKYVSEALENLQVRIVKLSPMRIACYRAISKTPEDDCAKVMNEFIGKHGLSEKDYGFRHFGFNNPDPVAGSDIYGYEMWVSIPKGLEVNEPLWEGQMLGGLYASIPTYMSSIFENWQKLHKWVGESDSYEAEFKPEQGRQWLEENINFEHFYDESVHFETKQLDLLLPIRAK